MNSFPLAAGRFPRGLVARWARHASLTAGWRALVGLCATCLLSGWASAGTGEPRLAQPGDLSLAVSVVGSDSTITAHEPVTVRVEITNRATEDLTLRLASDLTTQVEVFDAKRTLVAATPKMNLPLHTLFLSPRLAAGAVNVQFLVVSGLYDFARPGAYSIRVKQLELSREMQVLAEGAASLGVLPFNQARLEARCAEILRSVQRGPSGASALPFHTGVTALYSVRHDAVLPCLDWLAREWTDRYAVLAMRRIGTERAMKLVNALAARKDRVGEEARRGLKMRLEPSFWDIEGE